MKPLVLPAVCRNFRTMVRTTRRSIAPHQPLNLLAGPLRAGIRRLLRARSACLQRLSEDHVHELRRAARRAQPLLAVLKRIAPKEKGVLEAQRSVRRILEHTGPLRDAQVRLPVVMELVREGRLRPSARKRATLEVRNERRSVHDGSALADIHPLQQVLRTPVDRLTGPRVLQAMEQVRVRWAGRLQHRIDELTPKDTVSLHRARIALKRYRYLLEAFPEVWKEAAPTGVSLSELQARLGRWNDARMLVGWCMKTKSVKRTMSFLSPVDLRAEERALRKLLRQVKVRPKA